MHTHLLLYNKETVKVPHISRSRKHDKLIPSHLFEPTFLSHSFWSMSHYKIHLGWKKNKKSKKKRNTSNCIKLSKRIFLTSSEILRTKVINIKKCQLFKNLQLKSKIINSTTLIVMQKRSLEIFFHHDDFLASWWMLRTLSFLSRGTRASHKNAIYIILALRHLLVFILTRNHHEENLISVSELF